MLRVAFVTGNFDYALDGVALTSQRQVAYLLDQGVPVRVYAPTATRVLPHAADVVPVPSVGVPGTPYRLALGLTPAARRELAAFRPTLVHLATPDLLGTAALVWANRRRVPAVATYHTHFSSYLRYYRAGFLEPPSWRAQRWFYRRCAETYVATQSMADELRSHGVDGNFVISPFGVDTGRFSPANRSDDWRRQRGIAPGEVVVLFVGRLVWEKGLRLWAEVVRRLEKEGVPHRSLIVGEGPAAAALRAMLPHTVFTGRLSGDELATAFASADVFFFPSASETLGCGFE
jgi:phosphatidylinositol alpha 1,6-mannosyltransferase